LHESHIESCILHCEVNDSPCASSFLSFVPGSRLAIETKGFTSGKEEPPSRDRFSLSVTVIMPFFCEQEGKRAKQAADGAWPCLGDLEDVRTLRNNNEYLVNAIYCEFNIEVQHPLKYRV
jgi:hypothetical protein